MEYVVHITPMPLYRIEFPPPPLVSCPDLESFPCFRASSVYEDLPPPRAPPEALVSCWLLTHAPALSLLRQLMVFQLQFVSLLRLMEANITTPFMDFLDSLKWMNLHFEVDVSFFNCNDEVRVRG